MTIAPVKVIGTLSDFVIRARDIDQLPERSAGQATLQGQFNPLARYLEILDFQVCSSCATLVDYRGAGCAANSDVRIYHQVAGIRERKNKPLDKFHGKLARMGGFLHVVVLHIRDHPNVAGFLPSGLQVYCPLFGPLKAFLPGYFCGTRIGSRLKTYWSPLVNQTIVS